MILINACFEQFISESSGKKLVCFGAGNTFADLIHKHAKSALEEKITYFVDSNKEKVFTFLEINGKRITIFPTDYLRKEKVEDIVLLITSKFYEEICEYLDREQMFDKLHTYIWLPPFMCLHTQHKAEVSLNELHVSRNYQIPKIIHYCWFGRGDMGERERRCLESWRQYCPEYKICLWNEDNYDVTKNTYMRDAYDNKKWSFVSDYARLDIIYQYGGIYLDTDVELIKPLDLLINFRGFFGFENFQLLNTGLGFGAVPGVSLVKDLRDLYENISFLLPDGNFNLQSCPMYHTSFFKDIGIKPKTEIQTYEDIVLLPEEYLCPINQLTGLLQLSKNTFAIHSFSCSWFEKEDLDEWKNKKESVEKINKRLLHDFYQERTRNDYITGGGNEDRNCIVS